MTWDVNGPDNMSVKVYSVSSFPDTLADACENSPGFDPEWTSEKQVGTFTFINDAPMGGYIVLGNTQYKYQDQPSTITIDGASLVSKVFRFELSDETTNYNAKFRASNLEWPA
jgi:hypothetical protein